MAVLNTFRGVFSLFLSLSLLQCFPVSANEQDFTFEVGAGKTECFFQTVSDPKHVNMDIDYQFFWVINGGDLNINFVVSNPNHVVVANDQMKMDAYHRINVVDLKGDYQICFDNSFSYQTAKLVFFEVLLLDKDDRTDDLPMGQTADVDKQKMADIGITLEDFKITATRIKTNLNKAEHFQALLRAFEARDRAIMEANFDRVNFWSVVNGVVLVAVGFVQVYTIRSLFDENSKLRRILHRNK